MDNRHVCPECDKPYKHLMTHLQNKHKWDVDDIFNYKSRDKVSGEEDVARKAEEAELEVESSVTRSVDKSVMMYALTDMNNTIQDVYNHIDESMKTVVMEAEKMYHRNSNLLEKSTSRWILLASPIKDGNFSFVAAWQSWRRSRNTNIKSLLTDEEDNRSQRFF